MSQKVLTVKTIAIFEPKGVERGDGQRSREEHESRENAYQ
jgi:hypothetical protein